MSEEQDIVVTDIGTDEVPRGPTGYKGQWNHLNREPSPGQEMLTAREFTPTGLIDKAARSQHRAWESIQVELVWLWDTGVLEGDGISLTSQKVEKMSNFITYPALRQHLNGAQGAQGTHSLTMDYSSLQRGLAQ